MMLRAVNWLKDALTTKGVVPALTHYVLEPGWMGATDGRLVAFYPVTYDGRSVLLPGAALEKVLASVGPDKDLTITWPDDADSRGVLKAGKLRATFTTMARVMWPYQNTAPDVTWVPWSADLLESLRALEPFIGSNAQRVWSTCVGFFKGNLLATTNVNIARVRVADAAVQDLNCLLPKWAYDFLLSHHDGLESWAFHEDAWYFKWDTGAWVKCVGVIGTFPEAAVNIIEANPVTDAAFIVTPEWRSAYHQLAELTPDTEVVTLTHDAMEGGEEQAHVRVEDGIGGDAHRSLWMPKYLSPVVARAARIQFTNYPKPAGFVSADGRLSGVVLGSNA